MNDSIEGEEASEVVGFAGDSAGEEGMGWGGGELAWNGFWEKCWSSAAWSSTPNWVLKEN